MANNDKQRVEDEKIKMDDETESIRDHREGAPWQTGYFRDGQRRVDMVLVMQENLEQNLEALQIEYLMSLVDVGLEMEVENGVMLMHRHLTFVKLHAPDSIIEEYGTYFDVRKFFKVNHVAYMHEGVSAERELIQLTRQHYPGPGLYSTVERSTIVYRLLHVLPFGRNINYFGLHRLLQNEIVLDAYTLHDGPYFLLPKQREDTATARQALFYCWTGWSALYKGQPKHLIREYFGERIGFVFAFWEALIRLLLVLALVGVVGAVIGLTTSNERHKTVNDAACASYSYQFAAWKSRNKRRVTSTIHDKKSWMYSYYNKPRLYFIDFQDISNRTAVLTVYVTQGATVGMKFPYFNNFDTNWQKVGDTQYSFYTDRAKGITYVPPLKNKWKWDHVYKLYPFTLSSKHNVTRTEDIEKWNFVTVHYDDLPICPKCRDFVACPFRNLSEYCNEVKFKNKLDSPPAAFASLCAAILGWVFFFSWWKQEDYLTWLWEVPSDACRNTIRVQYKFAREAKGAFKRGVFNILIQAALCIAVGLCLLINHDIQIPVTIHKPCDLMPYIFQKLLIAVPALILFKYKVLSKTVEFDKDFGWMLRTYLVIICFGMVSALVTAMIEDPYRWVVFKMADLGNHRTEETFERVIALQWAGLTFLINFTMFYFFGVIKGIFYTFPSDPSRWNMVLGLGMMNCGLLGCFDVLLLFGLAFTTARRSFKVFQTIMRRDPVDSKDLEVPCWEREYRLNKLDEDAIMDTILMLVLRYAESTLFMVVFPLAPLFACILNLWDIRSEARRVLMNCRRPMLLKTHGLGAWREILALMPFLIGLSNVLVFVINTNMFDRILYSNEFPQARFFVDYAMGFFNITDLNREPTGMGLKQLKRYQNMTKWLPDFCLFPGKWNRLIENYENNQVFDDSYTPTMNKWYINWQQSLFVLVYQAIVALMGVALWRICWSSDGPHSTEQLRVVEAAVRTYQLEVEQVKKSQ